MRSRFSTDVAILPRLKYPPPNSGLRVGVGDYRGASGSALIDPWTACTAHGGVPLSWNLSDIGASLMGFTDVLSLR